MTDDEIRQLISDRIELQQAKQTESQKEVAYYGALIGAWISTRFEFDKSLFTYPGQASVLS